MTLADLLTELSIRSALKKSRVPAMKTSLKYLAEALDHEGPEQCLADAALSQEATWGKDLETHFGALEAQGRTISAYTRRNVRNDIRKIFTLAETHGLLEAPLPSRLLPKPDNRHAFRRSQRATAPYQTTYRPQSGPRHFGLPQAQWPPDITQGFQAYRARCGLRLRETTFRGHARRLEAYLGYLANICGRPPAWEDLFDAAGLTEFVRWHAARLERPITRQGHLVVATVAAMAHVLKHPHAGALGDLRQMLPTPAPMHTKRNHMVKLRDLEAVAEACLAEGRAPYVVDPRASNPGARRASHFQRGVMLKLLVRIPLRQRNVRELRLEKHLYQDEGGHWVLHFSGADLKIGERQGRINEYRLNLSEDAPDLLPVLEEFRTVYRPRLPQATTSPFLFLTQKGTPYTQRALHTELSETVAMRTGKRFYPHLIRTIWATEYLTDDAPDWTTAAVMLGDKVATVMASYHDLVDEPHHAKAKAFVAKQLGKG